MSVDFTSEKLLSQFAVNSHRLDRILTKGARTINLRSTSGLSIEIKLGL